MGELKLFSCYILKLFSSLALITKKPISLIIAAPVVTTAIIIDLRGILDILLWTFAGDFVSGVYASYIETKVTYKKIKKSPAVGFWRKLLYKLEILRETISSEKLRKSFVKALVYMAVIFFSFKLEQIFAFKTFKMSAVSERDFTVTTIVISIAIFIEAYSIFFENLPRAGFDIGAAFSKSVRGVKKVKKEVQED